MAADIKTVMKMDNSEVEAKLKQLNKHFRSTYNDWVDATDEVIKIDKKLIGAKKALADASRENSKHIKANIALLQRQKNAIKATQMARKAEYSSVKTGIQNIENDTKAKKTNRVSTESSTNSIVRHIRQLESLVVAYYAVTRGFQATIGIGLEVNRMMEDNRSGIAALLSANTQMVLSNGQMVTSYEKFQIGQQVAAQTMEDLRKASVKTYATFPQLTEIFQQAIGQTLSMGDAFGSTVEEINQNTIKLSQRMSNIGGAIGQPMDRIREEIRSLLSGNASTDSLIATMIFGSPGEANKAIRMAKDRGKDGLTQLLNSVLEPFDILEGVSSYTRSLLQLEDAWSQTMATMSKPVFEDLKVTFETLAKDINESQKDITEGFEDIYEITKDLVPILTNVGVGIAAIKLAAKVNPFTAWAVALAESVIALQKISEKRFEVSQSVETKRLVGRTSGISAATPKADVISAQASLVPQLETFARYEEIGKNKEKMEALTEEWIRLQGIIDGTAQKLAEYSEQATLVTKHNLRMDLVEEAGKATTKGDPKVKLLQEQIEEYNLAIQGFGKAWSEVTTDKARENQMESISTLLDGVEVKEREIAKIRMKAFMDELEATNELWTAQQNLLGIEVKKSDMIRHTIAAKGEELVYAKEGMEFNEQQAEILRLVLRYNQEINKEEEKSKKEAEKNLIDLGQFFAQAVHTGIQDGFDGDFDFGKIASQFASSLGSAMVSSSITSLIPKDMGIGGGLLGGVALMGISSLMGGDTKSASEQAEERFSKFMESLDKASQALEEFGNIGSSISNQIESLQSQILTTTSKTESLRGRRAGLGGGAMGQAFDEMIKSSTLETEKLKAELSSVISSSLGESLDLSALSTAQLKELISDVDIPAMQAYETELNNIALAHKLGKNTAEDTARATEILSDAEFAKYKDFAVAMEDVAKANEDMISSLQSVFESLQDTIDSLRGAAGGSAYTLGLYNQSMKESQALLASGDMDAFGESVSRTQGLTSVLFDEATFAEYGRTADIQQRFAQSVAANQFEAMQTDVQTEIDILTQIEENTRTTSSVVTSTALPSFAVGTTNVSSDMTANIHRGEIIIPSSFSDGLRRGDLSVGNNDKIVEELQMQTALSRIIIANQNAQTKIADDSKNIQQASYEIIREDSA